MLGLFEVLRFGAQQGGDFTAMVTTWISLITLSFLLYEIDHCTAFGPCSVCGKLHTVCKWRRGSRPLDNQSCQTILFCYIGMVE